MNGIQALQAAAVALLLTVLVNSSSSKAQGTRNRGLQPESSGPAASPQNGGYYALLIGIDNYMLLPKLATPISDANAIAGVLHDRYGFEVAVLPDASRHQILTAVEKYRAKLKDGDSLLIYYAGHGQFDKDANKGYWLPADAEPDTDANWIIADEITSQIRVLPARHVLLVSDSCYSGTLTRSILPGGTIDPNQYLQKMEAGKSRNLMSSGGNEPVADGGAPGHSVFANAFLQGLKDMDASAFTAMDLFNSAVQRRVVGGSDQVPQYMPIPDSGDIEGDFVFVRLRGANNVAFTNNSAGDDLPPSSNKPDTGRSDFAAARQQVVSKGYPAAFPLFQKAAAEGSAEAMFAVGEYYDTTESNYSGVVKDDSQAADWYRKSANAGNNSAMRSLGSMYDSGRGLEQDTWQAMQWYRKGAAAGNAKAMTALGRSYMRGEGTEPDYAQAMSWFQKAAQAGEPGAMISLGSMYASGRGTGQDTSQAASWYAKAMDAYRKAADAGDTSAMFGLAGMYDVGEGTTRDPAQAMIWYRRAADAGDLRAIYALASRYQNGRGASADPAQAVTWYSRAANAGDTASMLALAQLYAHGNGINQDYQQAVSWFTKAATAGSLPAMMSLAGMNQNGAGVVKNDATAQQWFQKAAERAQSGGGGIMNQLGSIYQYGNTWLKPDGAQAAVWYQKAIATGNQVAMCNLAALYERGFGIPKDDTQAAGLYRKAADGGNRQGMVGLGKMYLDGAGVARDPAQALIWFQKAATVGGAPVMWQVGKIYEGDGTDYSDAMVWYSKAALLGNSAAMFAIGSLYERGLGVPKDLSQASAWYSKASAAGYSQAAAKLASLGPVSSSPPTVNPATLIQQAKLSDSNTVTKYPAFAGTWVATGQSNSGLPQKLVLQQQGPQVVFAGFHMPIRDGVATWTGTQNCAPQYQHTGSKYGSGDAAGTATLRMSLKGDTLVYEGEWTWQSPCDGHQVGTERKATTFQRASSGQ
jgi:TPR repeat protein